MKHPKRVYFSCLTCKEVFTTNNFSKHITRCLEKGCSFDRQKRNKSKECIFCKKLFVSNSSCANHILQCDLNPNRIYRKTNYSWNKGLNKYSDERILNSSLKLKETIKEKYPEGFGWNVLTKEQRSKYAKDQGFGGYRENAGRSKKFKVMDSFGKETTLQSSYELQCKEVLEELNIKWIRPKALKYNNRNYFADFYLVDYDIYLDPKNDYKAKQDEEKIRLVMEQNNVKVFILLKDQINKKYIAGII